MLEVFISVAVSALLTAGLLYVTRQRLARQFSDIQRRLLEVERVTAAIKQQLERSTTAAELQRLHVGMVRLQENIARRYGPLLPAKRDGGRAHLSELQRSGLEQWASALGAPCDSMRIDELLRVAGREKLPAAMPDAIARVIAIPGWSAQAAAVGIAGDPAFTAFLQRAAGDFFERVEFFPASPGMAASPEPPQFDALILDETISPDGIGPLSALVKPGGLLVAAIRADEGEPELPQFDLVARAWNTSAFRKSAAP